MFSTSVTDNSISDTIKNNTYALFIPIFNQTSKIHISTKHKGLIDEPLVVLD
jgi:hypothetical protein